MKKLLLAIPLLILPLAMFSQAELVINGTSEVTIVEHGGSSATPIYLEINNPGSQSAANPGIPTPTGTKGFIISENEYDIVKWDIGTTANSIYTIPFGYNGGTNLYYLPLTVGISTAGGISSGTGSISFSTWHTTPDNFHGTTSLTGDPAAVTNMHSMSSTMGSPYVSDNSFNAISRFWTIKPSATYTTTPTFGKGAYSGPNGASGTGIQFSFIDQSDSDEIYNAAIENALNKSIPTGNLAAQRFNTGLGTWGDWLGAGSSYAGGVGGGGYGATAFSGAITATNFYSSWTLSNDLEPLPITMGPFTAICNNGIALIQWQSEAEINNDYYTVKKTSDDSHFETVGTVKSKADGNGNSSQPLNYSLTDNSPFPGTSYYVLYQTDMDGNMSGQLSTYQFNGCEITPISTVNAYNTSYNYIVVQINSADADNYNISLTNMIGQTILQQNYSTTVGLNEVHISSNVSGGIYILNVRNDKTNYSRKMVLGVR